MHETPSNSPEAYIDRLERQFRRRGKVRAFLVQMAVCGAFFPDPQVMEAVFKQNQKPDTLPHD